MEIRLKPKLCIQGWQAGEVTASDLRTVRLVAGRVKGREVSRTGGCSRALDAGRGDARRHTVLQYPNLPFPRDLSAERGEEFSSPPYPAGGFQLALLGGRVAEAGT